MEPASSTQLKRAARLRCAQGGPDCSDRASLPSDTAQLEEGAHTGVSAEDVLGSQPKVLECLWGSVSFWRIPEVIILTVARMAVIRVPVFWFRSHYGSLYKCPPMLGTVMWANSHVQDDGAQPEALQNAPKHRHVCPHPSFVLGPS